MSTRIAKNAIHSPEFTPPAIIEYIKIGMATTITDKIPTNPYMVEAKWIWDFVIPFFSISPVKKASDEIPPAGRNILIRFLLRNKIMAVISGMRCRMEANEATYINPCKMI